jgi:hypothetical protein
MSRIRFLFDECTDPDLIEALLRREPIEDALRVGWPDAPPEGTLDPELLVLAESVNRVLVSNDRKSMPGHLADHFAAGRHTVGVILLRKYHSMRTYVEELLRLWSADEAEEWVDHTVYIPLTRPGGKTEKFHA